MLRAAHCSRVVVVTRILSLCSIATTWSSYIVCYSGSGRDVGWLLLCVISSRHGRVREWVSRGCTCCSQCLLLVAGRHEQVGQEEEEDTKEGRRWTIWWSSHGQQGTPNYAANCYFEEALQPKLHLCHSVIIGAASFYVRYIPI